MMALSFVDFLNSLFHFSIYEYEYNTVSSMYLQNYYYLIEGTKNNNNGYENIQYIYYLI